MPTFSFFESNNMNKFKIAYLKTLPAKEIESAIKILADKYPDLSFNQKAISYDESIRPDEDYDLIITSLRDCSGEQFSKIELARLPLMVTILRDIFPSWQQTVEKEELTSFTCLIPATTEEDLSELHYYRDILKISSKFLAVNSYSEANLLASTDSGYMVISEPLAYYASPQLQKLFLLENGKQVYQDVSLLVASTKLPNEVAEDFGQIVQCQFNYRIK